MATLPYQPQNLQVEQADGNILLTWTGSLGATSYQIQRSTDGVNFTTLATSSQALYVDALPGVGQMFYYQVAGVNSAGTSAYSSVAQMVAAGPGEMSLYELRLRAQQTADRVDSSFVDAGEWNAFARLALYELYDLIIDSYEDYFASQTVQIVSDGSTANYPLPNGVSNYLGGTYGGSGTPSPAFYKLAGMDLNVNSSQISPVWVTLKKFNFIDRNRVLHQSTANVNGVYDLAYRIMGNNINFIPTPQAGQTIRLWYSPRLPQLLSDTDLTTVGFSGWLRYPIVRMAKYALDKEEGSDTSKLDTEIAFLKQRIEQASQNRDAGQPDTISETRVDQIYGNNWGNGGW